MKLLMLSKVSMINIDCGCYNSGSLKDDGSDCNSNEPCPCHFNGACTCAIGYNGDKCDQCDSGYYQDENNSDFIATCTGN